MYDLIELLCICLMINNVFVVIIRILNRNYNSVKCSFPFKLFLFPIHGIHMYTKHPLYHSPTPHKFNNTKSLKHIFPFVNVFTNDLVLNELLDFISDGQN